MFNISITNFKNVIETKTYSFEPGAIIHLVGPSGAGKSTILWAIEWGLFGRLGGVKHRSRRDLIPHVSIETDKIHIDRNGSDLTVTIKVTGVPSGGKPPVILTSDAAQGHIYKEFGDKDLWKSCSYLEQRCRNLLLEGSGEDKLRILRELVYGYGISQENDPEYYLIKIQEKLKKTLSDKKTYQAIYDSFYHEMEKEIEKYSKINNKWEDYENNTEEGGDIIFLKEKIGVLTSDFKSLSKYHNDQLHVKKSIIDLEKRLSKIKKEESRDLGSFTDEHYNSQRENTLISIDHLTESLQNQELSLKIKEFIPFKINANLLQDLKIKQSNRKRILADFTSLGFKIKSKEDCDQVKQDLDLQDIAEEFVALKEINKIIEEVEDYSIKIEQSEKRIDELKISLDIDGTSGTIKNDLICSQGSLKKSIQGFKSRVAMKCPCCKESVYLSGDGNNLIVYKDIDIEDIKNKLQIIESKLDIISKIEKQESLVKELKTKLKSKQGDLPSIFDKDRYNELLSVESNIPKINTSLIKNKDNLLRLIEKYDDNFKDYKPLDEMKQISELENGESLSKLLGQKLKDYLNDPDSFKVTTDCNIKDKIKELKESLRELENKKSMWMKACSEKEFLEKELEDFKKKIDENHDEKELKKMESELENLRSLEIDWIRYEEMRLKIDKLDEYEHDLRKVNSDVEILETLYEKIKKLSIEPVEKIIEVINYKLNEHLDKLFTETPIKVLLSLFRQSSGASRDSFLKISVNIQVYHGENNYPNISSLSGGEADRVSLALTLTLAEIFGSPIILLDECMASLDADLRESCLEIIKDMSVTVIDVCHESVEGYHDMIISVID